MLLSRRSFVFFRLQAIAHWAMASTSRALSKLSAPHLGVARARLQSGAASGILTATPAYRRAITTRPVIQNRQTAAANAARQFRRGYADEVAQVPAPKKPRRFRALKWLLWRLPILTIVGGIAYIGYGIYEDRHPEPQVEPDPTKKTLVILGMSCVVLQIVPVAGPRLT